LISNVRKLGIIEKSTPTFRKIPVEPVIDTVVQAVRQDTTDKALMIRTSIIPPTLTVDADDYISDVFYNLIHNAAFHNHEDIAEISIAAQMVDGGKITRITFEDNGSGIPESRKNQILARIAKKKEGFWGTGIGLTLTKHIIDYYNGSIRIEDRVEYDHSKGTRFIIDLPNNPRSSEESHSVEENPP
jgi:two-component system phosphate regulon sensor histidine kinase PhoR